MHTVCLSRRSTPYNRRPLRKQRVTNAVLDLGYKDISRLVKKTCTPRVGLDFLESGIIRLQVKKRVRANQRG